MLIRDFLRDRGPVVTCHPTDSLMDAATLLADKGIGVVAVIDENFRLAGVLSERDLVRVFVKRRAELDHLKVSDAMSRKIIGCSPGNSHVDAAALMRRHKVRHLPVVEDEMLVGMISIRDLLEVFGPTRTPENILSPIGAAV